MKKQLLLILGLMFTATLFAAPITKDSAKKNVMSFLQNRGGNKMFATAGMNQAQLTKVDYKVSGDAFYIFNVGNNGGFVIAAADDRVESILGYSYEGSFDPENIPANMKQWLDIYAQEISAVKDLDIQAPAKLLADGTKTPYRHTIPVMLTCRWNQDSPYNDDCPDFKDGYGHRPTGCVATAMAQVMYFHKWPKEPIADLPAYSYYDEPMYGGSGKTINMDGLPGVQFDWDNMLDEYNYNSLKESKKAVAQLMRYCGQAVKMGYHPYASGAYTFDMPEAMRKLGYDKGAKYIEKVGYSKYDWEDIVYNELANNRPVLYSGMAVGAGGHQFVCDGYENEFFHFNWGWGGQSDGYFKLTSLNPSQQGVIGGNGLDFSEGQQIVIGVQAPTEGTVMPEDTPRLGYMRLSKNFDGKFKKNNLGKVSIYVSSIFSYDGEKDAIFTVGYGLFDKEGNLIEVSKQQDKQFIAGFTSTHSEMNGSISIGKEAIANDGTYYLRAIVKSNRTGEFYIAPNAEKTYFEVQVSGEEVFVTPYPIANIEITNLHFDGEVYQGSRSELKATFVNKGEDIEGVLYLTHAGKIESSLNELISMKKGEKREVSLVFFAPTAGTDSFGLSVNGRTNSEEIEVTVKESATKSASLEFAPEVDLTSDGNYFDIPVEITNKSVNNEYKGLIKAIFFQKTGYTYYPVKEVTLPVEIEKQGKTSVVVHMDDLKFNNYYHLGFAFYQYTKEKIYGGVDADGNPKKTFSKYKTADALSYYDEFGNMDYKLVAEGETFDIPANACYVNMPKTITGRTINKSSNPNCIYNVKKGTSSASLEGCNIVKSDYCAALNISDSYNFYSESIFTASEVNITINVDKEITALFLPFEPTSVKCDGVELIRANNVNEVATSDFALMPIVAEDANAVYCDFDPSFVSAPSILSVNSKYIGKALVFSVKGCDIDLSKNLVRGNYFSINSSNRNGELTEPFYGFAIDTFNKSVKNIAPFRLYLTPSGSNAETVKVVYPDGFNITGIEEIEAENGKMVNIYSIDGVKVRTAQYGDKMLEGLPSGLYIVNGKKIVK